VTGRAEGRPAGLLALVAAAAALAIGGVAVEVLDLFPQLRFAVQRNVSDLPSTRAVPRAEVLSGLPLFSVYLQPDDLRTLMENKMEHGRQWERPGTISYFDEGRLLFAGSAGVRVHGGGSRITSPTQSFRLFFRREYGATHFAPGVLFGPESHPLKRLVVHNDVRKSPDGRTWHLANPLAYDLSRRIGGITPETKPARFFLNGKHQGLYVLTEHFDDEYFDSHRPGRRVTMEIDDMEALRDRLDAIRPLTMEAASELVDLDNVTSWFLAAVFTAARDAYQGPGQFLDEDAERAGWFWVTWDLDESFRDWDLDSFQYLLERVGERPRGRRASEPRSLILSTLIAEDSQFRTYLAGRIDTMLNHQLTPEFVEERRSHYAKTALRLGVPDPSYIERQRDFLVKRPAFVRHIAEQWLNTPPGLHMSVRRSDGGVLRVDGFDTNGSFEGTYFPGREIVISLPDQGARWFVDGVAAGQGPELRLTIDRPADVVAVIGTAVPPTPQRRVSQIEPHAKAVDPPAWRPIPPGSFEIGCTEGDRLCESNEWPRLSTTVQAGFEMMSTEVTVEQFEAFARASGRRAPRQPHWSAPSHPVVNLTWDEAFAYCTAVGGRLPTETEWEYAARGGRRGYRFPTRNEPTPEIVNGLGLHGPDRWGMTAPVGSFAPNGFGLFDMAGNVWEWTSSWYREDPSWMHPPDQEPTPESLAYAKTVRGGSWDSAMRNLRVSRREGLSPRGRHNLYVGFRCVR
jgi:formylglycine-generating enzyme required for sulfatase activity